MLQKNIFKELKEYLKKHNAPWFSEEDGEDYEDAPILSGRAKEKRDRVLDEMKQMYYGSSSDPDMIALNAFLKNKQIFSNVLMDAIGSFDKKSAKEHGHKFSEVYKKACISKQVFSNLFNGKMPSKDTVIMFAFALETLPEEAEQLLKHAGYSFGDCVKRDLIFAFCLERKIFDICDVNELLRQEREGTLGKDRIKSKGRTLTVLR